MNRYFNRPNYYTLLGMFAIFVGAFRMGQFWEWQFHVGGSIIIGVGIFIISTVLGFLRARIDRLEKELE